MNNVVPGLTTDPETPKGQQKHLKGVYVMSKLGQAPAAPQKSRFAAREQVRDSSAGLLLPCTWVNGPCMGCHPCRAASSAACVFAAVLPCPATLVGTHWWEHISSSPGIYDDTGKQPQSCHARLESQQPDKLDLCAGRGRHHRLPSIPAAGGAGRVHLARRAPAQRGWHPQLCVRDSQRHLCQDGGCHGKISWLCTAPGIQAASAWSQQHH